MENKIILDWEGVGKLVHSLANSISKLPITGIYGLSRGGLIPGVMLSHTLGIPFYTSYRDGCIVVDDICDSGDTFTRVYNNINSVFPEPYSLVFTACLHLRHTAGYVPTVYGELITDDSWVVYPWERLDSKHQRDGTPTN